MSSLKHTRHLMYRYTDSGATGVTVSFKSGPFLVPEDCMWFEITVPNQFFAFLVLIRPSKVHLEGAKDMNTILSYMEKLENDFIK